MGGVGGLERMARYLCEWAEVAGGEWVVPNIRRALAGSHRPRRVQPRSSSWRDRLFDRLISRARNARRRFCFLALTP